MGVKGRKKFLIIVTESANREGRMEIHLQVRTNYTHKMSKVPVECTGGQIISTDNWISKLWTTRCPPVLQL
jgi:hypothetical protein